MEKLKNEYLKTLTRSELYVLFFLNVNYYFGLRDLRNSSKPVKIDESPDLDIAALNISTIRNRIILLTK